MSGRSWARSPFPSPAIAAVLRRPVLPLLPPAIRMQFGRSHKRTHLDDVATSPPELPEIAQSAPPSWLGANAALSSHHAVPLRLPSRRIVLIRMDARTSVATPAQYRPDCS